MIILATLNKNCVQISRIQCHIRRRCNPPVANIDIDIAIRPNIRQKTLLLWAHSLQLFTDKIKYSRKEYNEHHSTCSIIISGPEQHIALLLLFDRHYLLYCRGSLKIDIRPINSLQTGIKVPHRLTGKETKCRRIVLLPGIKRTNLFYLCCRSVINLRL